MRISLHEIHSIMNPLEAHYEKNPVLNYEITYEEFLKCWIVWEVHRNCRFDIYHGHTKRACKMFLENLKGGEKHV